MNEQGESFESLREVPGEISDESGSDESGEQSETEELPDGARGGPAGLEIVGESAIAAGEGLPSLEEINTLLDDSNAAMKFAVLSEADIDKFIERHERAVGRLAGIEALQNSRLARVERFDPYGQFSPDDLDRLVKEEIADKDYADLLKKVDTAISQWEALPAQNLTTEDNERLAELERVRQEARERFLSESEKRQRETLERKNNVLAKVAAHYEKQADHLAQVIEEIEKNPRVAKKLSELSVEEKRRIEAEKQKAEAERIAAERERRESNILEARRFSQSILDRNQVAFTRLRELLMTNQSEESGTEEDIASWLKNNISKARAGLRQAILEGDGPSQLKRPGEVVPWRMSSGIHYSQALNFLKTALNDLERYKAEAPEDRKAKLSELIQNINQAVSGSRVIFDLIGPESFRDRQTGKQVMGWLWAALAERQTNDKSDRTKELRRARAEAETSRAEAEQARREFEAGAQEIIAQGGFRVAVPEYQTRGGRQVVWRTNPGVVRLEKKTSPRTGNDYWEVAETFHVPEALLRVGQTALLDMNAFPAWLKNGAMKTKEYGPGLRAIEDQLADATRKKQAEDQAVAEAARARRAEEERARADARQARKGRGNPGKGNSPGKKGKGKKK